ncbi:MAG: hypothetical protein RBR38_10450 [Desulfomicrobium apsheronum]|jgi:hypothetical protein|nr:hypothetical protein [Desulfomicrobium apsheronum]
MSIEQAATVLHSLRERRRGIGYINMNALTVDEKTELAVKIAKLDREIILAHRELDKEINK